MKYISFILILVFLMSSCTSSEEITVEDTTEPEVSKTTSTDYIWLSEEAASELAKKNNVSFRVTTRDNQPLPATMDFRPGRINASVINGIVVDYDVEG